MLHEYIMNCTARLKQNLQKELNKLAHLKHTISNSKNAKF